MKKFAMPLFAMALSTSVHAQSPDDANWAGSYGGFQIDVMLDGSESTAPTLPTLEFDGQTYDLFAGHRWQFGDVVVGAEYDLSTGRFRNTNVGTGVTNSARLANHRLGLEAGYDAGRFLPYAILGFSYLRVDTDLGDLEATGAYYGIGLDYQVYANSTLGFELTGSSFGNFNGYLPTDTPNLNLLGINFAVSF